MSSIFWISMKKTRAENFKFLPSSRAYLFSSFTNNTFSKYLAPCTSMTEQIHRLLQNVDELLIWTTACRLSVSPVVLQQVVHTDLLGTSTAGCEKLNGKERKTPTKRKNRRKIRKEICSKPLSFKIKCGRISYHHDFLKLNCFFLLGSFKRLSRKRQHTA